MMRAEVKSEVEQRDRETEQAHDWMCANSDHGG